MKVKVISVFRDKFTGKYYTPGEVIEVSEESRVLDMESRRLAERVEAKTTEVKAPEEKKEVNFDMYIIYNLNNKAHYVCDGFNARWIKDDRELRFYKGEDGHNKIKFPITNMWDSEFRSIYPNPKKKN